MKNATKYQKKLKKFLATLPKASLPAPAPDQIIRTMLEAILAADATPKLADKALSALEKEYVDYNELRVSLPKEIVDCIGRDYPFAREKAQEIVTALNSIFSRYSALTLEPAAKMTKRDLRRHLAELGLGPYAAGYLILTVFGGHAIPVDQSLSECLELGKLIHPGSGLEDVQGFLERSILQKDAWAAHVLLRDYVDKSAKPLARKRKADAAVRAAAEAAAAQAAQEAEEKARAAQEAQAAKAAAKAAAAAQAAKPKARTRPAEKPAKRGAKADQAPKDTKAAKRSRKAPKQPPGRARQEP